MVSKGFIMQRDPDREFIKYNKILGKEASIGPIPANQLVAWVGITLICYIVTNGFSSLGLGWFFATSFWLIVSWWILTGNQPHQFLDKWRKPPGKEWCNGDKRYISPLPSRRPRRVRQRYGDSIVRVRLKPKIVPNQRGGKSRFMPFQNEVNLCCIAEIKKEGREVAAFLLERGKDQYQFVFAFQIAGIHDLLTRSEVSSFAGALEEGFKSIPPGEKITFCTGCYSDDLRRQRELETLADHCNLPPVSVLFRNEQKRVQELTQTGSRQSWQQFVFCTWTSNSNADSHSNEWWSNVVRFGKKWGTGVLSSITGNRRIYEEQFYQKLLLKAFQEGFVPWELLLNTRMGLNVTPCHKTELWQWLWHRFNQGKAPEIPQIITLEETETGFSLYETKTTDKHSVTVLIEGQNGESVCPEHQESHDTVSIRGRGVNKKCGVLTMVEPPSGWSSTREQLRWIWKIMSASFVRDTEAWIEISFGNNYLIQDNLARQAKQTKAAQIRALTKGQGRDVGAEVKQEESFDAQRRMYEGMKALHCAPVFLVYRETQEQLDVACSTLANNFDTAKVIRERHIAWEIWLQTLPITTKWLLHSRDLLSSERRLTPDTQTIAGFLPLTLPKDIDRSSVEFITDRGGKPIYIDLFRGEAKRALITGTSGSGKSVLGWRFALGALAQNLPVVGMDISSGGDSTFKTAVKLLGDQGAYFDISRGSSNLMEPPDLRRFPKAERQRRMESWKEFIMRALLAIALGKINNPHLAQRVESILRLTLDLFLKDPDIIDRYNTAFEKGWQSVEWQQMPTLHDFVRYCSRERLNLRSFEDLDRMAVNQVNSQITALLASRLGKAIGNPSTFSPEPAVKFFALSGLTSEQDAYLMAINAHTACIRNALSYPKSLFIGDELSVLLKRSGFAQMIGETCATGRKDGISVCLISQDPDSIYECATGAQIMQNMSYRITGRITSAASASFQKYLGYDPAIINRNASDAALPRVSDLYSYWLIEKDGRFWRTRFYPSEMTLASVANNQDEQAARDRIMSKYPDTLIGKLEGLGEFTEAYIPALKENQGFDHIGWEATSPASVESELPDETTEHSPRHPDRNRPLIAS
jgi:hypothetical protein